MIAYSTSTARIEDLVAECAPKWPADAAARTAVYTQERRYIGKDEYLPNPDPKARPKKGAEFWGRVKQVFVVAQYAKCAFCESALQKGKKALIQWDLEHFRPKAGVEEWPYVFATGPAMPGGYYRLAYHLGNYVASCKTCNTSCKMQFFPVQNARVAHGGTPADHAPEGAYLVYPLGDLREDPRRFLRFDGIEAVANNGSPRGQLLIDFFDLNREGLQLSRAQVLVHSFRSAYKGFLNKDTDCAETLDWLLSERAPHSNCTNCFLELCLSDHDRGMGLLRDIADWLKEQEEAALKLKRSRRGAGGP